MKKFKINKGIITGLVLAIGLPFIFVSCINTEAATETTTTPTNNVVVVDNAAKAKNAVLDYLTKNDIGNLPDKDAWNEKDITPENIVGSVTKLFTSGDWEMSVSYPVVLPDLTVYQVVVINNTTGYTCEVEVKADGTVSTIAPIAVYTTEQARQIAEQFVKEEPTFVFDGMPDTFKLVDMAVLKTPYGWQFTFEFQSCHAGYGNRTGQMVAQVITPHTAVVTVIKGGVAAATMDAKWDMLNQKMIDETVSSLHDGATSAQIEFTYDQLLNQKHVTQSIEIALPGSLIVTLGSNPTTGFQWQENAVIGDPAILNQYSHQMVEPQTGIMGAAGKEVFVFNTLAKGTSTIQLQYSRPWESG